MSRVFITGGAGLIGSHTARTLLDLGHEVTVYDSYQHYIVPPNATYLENLRYREEHLLDGAALLRGTTEDAQLLRRELMAAKPDHVIHLAALPIAGLAIRSPEEALRSIVQGTANVLDVVRDLPGLTRFVHVSSSMAYGNFATTPLPEHAGKNPVEVYGALKLSSEILTQTYGRLYGVPHVTVRPSAVYGPTDNNRRVVQALVERAMQRRPVKVTNPRSTYLDFTYVTDIARGLTLAAFTPGVDGEDFNITCGDGRSLLELADVLRAHFPDVEVDAVVDEHDLRPMRGTLDISKARRLLGYAPRTRLEAGVERYVDHVRTHNPSLSALRAAVG